jgi:hypothetical protein
LVSEGNVALLRSGDKFDSARGFKSALRLPGDPQELQRVMMRNGRYRNRFPVSLSRPSNAATTWITGDSARRGTLSSGLRPSRRKSRGAERTWSSRSSASDSP